MFPRIIDVLGYWLSKEAAFLSPAVAVGAAILSFVFFWRNLKLSKRMAARSLNLEAQKMLLDINRQLISDPWLWSIYDDHAVCKDDAFKRCCSSERFKAKREAFAYLMLNMFEVIFLETPESAKQVDGNASNTWLKFFHYSVLRSAVLRGILESPDAPTMYSPVLIARYKDGPKPKADA